MSILETPLYQYAKKLSSLSGKEDKIFKIVLDNKIIKDLIVYLNTDDQMGKDSIDSKGEKLFNSLTDRTTYSLFDKKGRGGKEYTLNDTGEFWDSFNVNVGEGRILIDADPIKDNDNLFDVYGSDIVGLTDENIKILINEALEQYKKYYKNTLL